MSYGVKFFNDQGNAVVDNEVDLLVAADSATLTPTYTTGDSYTANTEFSPAGKGSDPVIVNFGPRPDTGSGDYAYYSTLSVEGITVPAPDFIKTLYCFEFPVGSCMEFGASVQHDNIGSLYSPKGVFSSVQSLDVRGLRARSMVTKAPPTYGMAVYRTDGSVNWEPTDVLAFIQGQINLTPAQQTHQGPAVTLTIPEATTHISAPSGYGAFSKGWGTYVRDSATQVTYTPGTYDYGGNVLYYPQSLLLYKIT